MLPTNRIGTYDTDICSSKAHMIHFRELVAFPTDLVYLEFSLRGKKWSKPVVRVMYILNHHLHSECCLNIIPKLTYRNTFLANRISHTQSGTGRLLWQF